jgi:diphosphomevalonate decarboxylase
VRATAHAHPNIALIKYWGKAPGPGNVPATPSLSITLDRLTTRTQVATAAADVFRLGGLPIEDAKVTACLTRLRRRYPIPPVEIDSDNNFPTAAGLASSASGFAALLTALDALCGLGLTPAERSALAREASGSAGRSVFGGVVALDGPQWQGRQLLAPEEWPLEVVIAITDTTSKSVPSSVGMRLSAESSPYYPAWVESTCTDFAAALDIVAQRDFEGLAELAEHSCLKMHGLMLATRPGLLYWNAATLACLHAVRTLRAAGTPVFFTVDAGPQVKAICLPGAAAAVQRTLQEIPGVSRVVITGLGRGAWVDNA